MARWYEVKQTIKDCLTSTNDDVKSLDKFRHDNVRILGMEEEYLALSKKGETLKANLQQHLEPNVISFIDSMLQFFDKITEAHKNAHKNPISSSGILNDNTKYHNLEWQNLNLVLNIHKSSLQNSGQEVQLESLQELYSIMGDLIDKSSEIMALQLYIFKKEEELRKKCNEELKEILNQLKKEITEESKAKIFEKVKATKELKEQQRIQKQEERAQKEEQERIRQEEQERIEQQRLQKQQEERAQHEESLKRLQENEELLKRLQERLQEQADKKEIQQQQKERAQKKEQKRVRQEAEKEVKYEWRFIWRYLINYIALIFSLGSAKDALALEEQKNTWVEQRINEKSQKALGIKKFQYIN